MPTPEIHVAKPDTRPLVSARRRLSRCPASGGCGSGHPSATQNTEVRLAAVSWLRFLLPTRLAASLDARPCPHLLRRCVRYGVTGQHASECAPILPIRRPTTMASARPTPGRTSKRLRSFRHCASRKRPSPHYASTFAAAAGAY